MLVTCVASIFQFLVCLFLCLKSFDDQKFFILLLLYGFFLHFANEIVP